MKTQKMSQANIQGKLSRMEMKMIIAGDGDEVLCTSDTDCNTGGGYKCKRRSTDGVYRCVKTTVSIEEEAS